jgi:NAD(P)-dependent dehydrogenase (short-subunit alcohol dehydrogenase family)
MNRLQDRIVFITGGARGQGAAHALRLATEGARVVIADVMDEIGETEAANLRSQGLDVQYIHLDVSSPDSWQAAFVYLDSNYGKLDVLINNAGIIHVTPIEEETLEAWNRLMSVNLNGPFLGTNAMIPLLKKSDAGAIINVSSIFGPGGAKGYSAYTASKAALLGLTKTTALELAQYNIRVNAICPGGVSTPMNENEPQGGVVPETPMGRRAHVSEIAAAIAFLASSDASFMTGAELVVDGGYLAK